MDKELDTQNNSSNSQIVQKNTSNFFLKTFNNPIQPITISDNHKENLDSTARLETSNENASKDSTDVQQLSVSKTDSMQADSIQQIKNINMPKTKIELFKKTQSLLQYLADLSIFDSETLQKGMKIDLSNSNSLFFELYIGSELHLASAYVYVLDERSFTRKDSPDLHFIRCAAIQKMPKDLIKVCVPTKNAFDYRVRSSGVDTRLFYEHPLHICPLCIASLCELLSKKHKRTIHTSQIKEDEVMGLLFKNKLKNLVM